MKKVLHFIGSKLTLLLAVAIAGVVGGVTAGVVMAAIPDANGYITACYRNTGTGSMRAVDTAVDSCAANETQLSWPKQGLSAYARILGDGTIDTANSKNITASFVETGDGVLCLTVAGSPKNVQISPEGRDGTTIGALIRGISDDPQGFMTNNCPSQYNVVLPFGSQPLFNGAIFMTVFE